MIVLDLNISLRYKNGIDFRIFKCCILLIFFLIMEENIC